MVREYIAVNNKHFWTLFDSGARHTYVVDEVAESFQKARLEEVYEASLGGKIHKLKENVILMARIEGKPIATRAFVIDEIGTDEKGTEIKVLIGALTMQEWGIELDMKSERLDLTHYRKEFIEF